MTSLADKAILSGADNLPPMLEKDMYGLWKSRMELYMLNRQHGRMILESIENGPLLWPTVEENRVTRSKKYSELSTTEAIQSDCYVKATNISLQGLPPEVYALGESLRHFYLRFSLLLNDMNIYNMKLKQFQVNTKFLNTLPLEWSKFVTDVKLGRQNSMTTGISRQYTSGPSGTLGKHRVIVCYNCKGEGHMSKQCIKLKRKRDEACSLVQQDDLILSMIEQLKTQVINCTKINQDNKNVNEILTVELERYKDHVRILKEQHNVDKASESCAQSLEIENLKHTLFEHLKQKESLEQKVILLKNDFYKEESQNIDKELALEKHIKELNNIVFKRNQFA
nr:hypothetical protein [Tanacetum cinerariifolium]